MHWETRERRPFGGGKSRETLRPPLCRQRGQRIPGGMVDGPLHSRLASTQSIAGGEHSFYFYRRHRADSRDEKNPRAARKGTATETGAGSSTRRIPRQRTYRRVLEIPNSPAISTRDIVMRASDLCKSKLSNRGGRSDERDRRTSRGDL